MSNTADQQANTQQEAPRQRPRLNLKPRDEAAAAQLDMERKSSSKNPFGDAKPREAILAAKTGRTEEEIVREEASKTKIHVRLTPEQHEQRKAAYADIKQLQLQLDDLPDGEGEQREALQTELNAKQAALDNLVAHFQKLNTEAALKGELQRPSERRASLTAPDVPTNGSAPRTNYHPTRPHKNQGDLGGPRHSGGHRGLHDGDSGVYGLQGVQPGRGDYGRGEYERGDYGRGDYGGGRGDYGGGEYNGQYGSRGNYGRGGRRGGHYDPSRQYSGERLYQDDDWGSLKGHNYAGNYAATDYVSAYEPEERY